MTEEVDVEPFDFSLEEVVVGPFKIAKQDYILVEADSNTANEFRALTLKGVSMLKGRVQGLEGLAAGQPYLVSRCLFKLEGDSSLPLSSRNRVTVPLEVVSKWPERVVKPLYEKIREISDMKEDDPEDKEAKN